MTGKVTYTKQASPPKAPAKHGARAKALKTKGKKAGKIEVYRDEKRRLVVYVTLDCYRLAKIRAAQHGLTLSALFAKLIEELPETD